MPQGPAAVTVCFLSRSSTERNRTSGDDLASDREQLVLFHIGCPAGCSSPTGASKCRFAALDKSLPRGHTPDSSPQPSLNKTLKVDVPT